MITDYLIDWILDLVDFVVEGVPSESIPVTLSLAWISDINYFLPVSEMFELFLVMFLLGGPMLGTSLIVWVLVGVIRGGATKA